MSRCCDGYGCSRCAYGPVGNSDLVAAKDAEIERLKAELMAAHEDTHKATNAYALDVSAQIPLQRAVVDLTTWQISPEYWDAVDKHADTIEAARKALGEG